MTIKPCASCDLDFAGERNTLCQLCVENLNGARVRVQPVEWYAWWGVLFFDGEEWRVQSNVHPENCSVVQFKVTGRSRRRLSQSDLYGYRAQITFPDSDGDGKTGAWIVDERYSR